MRLFFLFILLIPSISFSETVRYSSISKNYNLVEACSGLQFGDVFDSGIVTSVCSGGKKIQMGNYSFTFNSSSYGYPYLNVYTTRSDGGNYSGRIEVTRVSCDSPKVINPLTGICEEPPACEDGFVFDASMENCVDDPNDDWCSDQVAQEYNSCYESNGIFDYGQWQCDESTHTVSSSKCDLTNSDKCYFGQPSYPACLGDSSDIKGPDSNYDPETPNTSNPDAGYDKSEPDSVTPDDSTDGAVLAAVQNMNRDMNDANTQINKDMNVGFGKIKDAVGQTNKNLDAIGKVLENSVGQDTQARREAADFYQGNLAGLQGIQAGVNNLGKSIDSGFGSLAEIYKGNISAPTSCTNFSCEGNAASCYLAQEQWRQYCAAGAELNNLSPAMAEVTNYLQETAEGYVDENGAMKGLYYDNPSTMEDYLSAYTQENGFNFASGCPQPRVYTVSIASASVKFALDFTPFCTLALVFRALLMATASIGSLLMFAKFM